MKKVVLTFFLVVTSLTIFAQTTTIVLDRESNGSRTIICKNEPLYEGSKYAIFSLGGSEDKYSRSFSLFISFFEGKLQMERGSRLLLKFDDDSVIELRTKNKIGPYDYKISKDGDYYVSAMYKITPQQIREMENRTLVKIRIECSNGEIDRELQSKLFALTLNSNLFDIINALEKPKDFYSDF